MLGGPDFHTPEHFSPLLAFDTDGVEFARGFEAGRLWTLLRERPDEPLEANVCAENAEMVLRIAEATQRPVHCEELGSEWLAIFFGAADDPERFPEEDPARFG
jgi:hypothetical protein